MNTSKVPVLAVFNKVKKRTDALYHNYAKKAGLSDAAFWLLYSLYEYGRPCTQKELCEEWLYPPQTVNSALKILEKAGIIRLQLAPDSRKNKQVFFTERGYAVLEETIIPLMEAEERSFVRLGRQERKAFLEITARHVKLLEEEINKIGQESSEDRSSQ